MNSISGGVQPASQAEDMFERQSQVIDKRGHLEELGSTSHPNFLVCCQTILTLCTSDVTRIQPQDDVHNRILFENGEWALQMIYVATKDRLGLTELTMLQHDRLESDLDVGYDMKNQLRMMPSKREQHSHIRNVLEHIQTLAATHPDTVSGGMKLIRLAIGGRHEGHMTSDPALASMLAGRAEFTTAQRNLWKKAMHEYVAIALIRMAQCLAGLYGGQSVAFFETRVPLSCFKRQ